MTIATADIQSRLREVKVLIILRLHGTNQGTAWIGSGFDDSAWMSGPAQLGYGDGDEATKVSFGPDPQKKRMTYYFRRDFEASDGVEELRLAVLADDGAIAYLNGTEVGRVAMPSGPIDEKTAASKTLSNSPASPNNSRALRTS